MQETPPKAARISALDWVKGALVVLMVVYHTLNYARYFSFQYLAFLPPSFIFITGFLLTSSYLLRYDVKDWRLHRRLQVRGVKLVVLYTMLNLGAVLAPASRHHVSSAGIQQFFENWRAVYLYPDQGNVSFVILLSIGYLLLIAPVLLVLQSLKAWLAPVLAVGIVALCCWLEWNGISNYHLNMFGAGVLGMAFGVVSLDAIIRFVRKWVFVLPLYLIYRACSFALGDPYVVQSLGVCTSLLLLFGVAVALPSGEFSYRQVVLLGRYSLFGYIFHLGVLQILFRTRLPYTWDGGVVLAGVTALVLTWATTKLIDQTRKKVATIDSVYKWIFA